MSNQWNAKKGLYVGNHVWFAEEGTTFGEGGSQTVDENNIPPADAGDNVWSDLGAVVKMSVNTEVEKITAQAPSPCILEDVDELVKKVKTTWTISVETITELGRDLIFGTTVDNATGKGVIASKPSRKGWLIWKAVDPNSQDTILCNIWGSLSKDGATDFGGDDFTKPEFTFTQLKSPLTNQIQFRMD